MFTHSFSVAEIMNKAQLPPSSSAPKCSHNAIFVVFSFLLEIRELRLPHIELSVEMKTINAKFDISYTAVNGNK